MLSNVTGVSVMINYKHLYVKKNKQMINDNTKVKIILKLLKHRSLTALVRYLRLSDTFKTRLTVRSHQRGKTSFCTRLLRKLKFVEL